MRSPASTSARASPSASAPALPLEAMEGTDAMLRRAAGLVNGRAAALVKVARRPRAPAVRCPGGRARAPSPSCAKPAPPSWPSMPDARLMLDKDEMLARGQRGGIAIVGYPPQREGN